MYKPAPELVPEFKVPSVLPNLPNIAENVIFPELPDFNDVVPSFKPSAPATPIEPVDTGVPSKTIPNQAQPTVISKPLVDTKIVEPSVPKPAETKTPVPAKPEQKSVQYTSDTPVEKAIPKSENTHADGSDHVVVADTACLHPLRDNEPPRKPLSFLDEVVNFKKNQLRSASVARTVEPAPAKPAPAKPPKNIAEIIAKQLQEREKWTQGTEEEEEEDEDENDFSD